MKLGRRLLLLVAFLGLAGVTALCIDRVVQPPATNDLLLATGLAVAAGLPGLVHRRLAPLSIALLPLGLYILMRLVVELPPDTHGWHEQYHFYTQELSHGLSAYANDIFPLTLAGVPGLRLLILVWVYLIVGLAAVLSLSGRRPLLGVGVLLVLLGAGLTVDAKARDPLLAAAFVILTVMVMVTAQGMSRRRWGLRDAFTGVGLGALGVAVALGLLTVQPGLAAGGWQDWRGWDPFGPGAGGSTVFNWKQNYPRLLDPGNNDPIMQVTSPLPSYWRATTLETFNGTVWISDIVFPHPLGEGPGTRLIDSPEPSPPGDEVHVRFELTGVTTNYLFVAGRPISVSIDRPYPIYASDSASLRSALNLDPPVTYSLTTVIPRVQPEELVGRGRDYPPTYRDVYLSLPFPSADEVRQDPAKRQEWESQQSPRFQFDDYRDVYALNDTIVGSATDPYEQALLIEDYLRTNYHYSLQVPPSTKYSPIAAFLFDTHTGYCQHFAGAMALLLRLNGIPSRVAVGFTTGKLVDAKTYEVTTNNAHSWVEAYFPGVGWLPFDPTPGRTLPLAGASSTSPGFTDPFPHVRPGGAGTGLPISRNPADRERGDEGPSTRGTVPGGRLSRTMALSAALTALILAAAIAWPALRRRHRERGLRSGDTAQRLQKSLHLLRSDLVDWGVPLSAATTLEEVANLAEREGAGDLRAVVDRAQAVFFGGYAAEPQDVRRTEDARRHAVAALRRGKGRLWSILVSYGLAQTARRAVPRVASLRRRLRPERPPRPQRSLT